MDFSHVDDSRSRELIEYLDFGSRFSRDDKLRTFAIQQLDAGMNVLDVGCGTGDDVRAIAEIVGSLGRVTGIDPSEAMIGEANARGVPSNATFGVGSAYTLPYADGGFDAVRADRVMQHLREPDVAASELRRVSKAGGTTLLLDQDWHRDDLRRRNSNDEAHRSHVRRALRAPVGWTRSTRVAATGGIPEGRFHDDGLGTPVFPVAFVTFLNPAVDVAVQAGRIDEDAGERWLNSLLEADQRGEFFCAIAVVVALGACPGQR